MRDSPSQLTPGAFVLLAILAERPAHGYHLRDTLHTRGFRFWVNLERSTLYTVLKKLEKQGLIASHLEAGGGPARKVYALTDAGWEHFRSEARRFLSRPSHPRNDVDLGIYALNQMSPTEARKCLADAVAHLRERRAFLQAQLDWCRARDMFLPALAFERPLLSIDADITWLEKVSEQLAQRPELVRGPGWERYEYLAPPNPDEA